MIWASTTMSSKTNSLPRFSWRPHNGNRDFGLDNLRFFASFVKWSKIECITNKNVSYSNGWAINQLCIYSKQALTFLFQLLFNMMVKSFAYKTINFKIVGGTQHTCITYQYWSWTQFFYPMIKMLSSK